MSDPGPPGSAPGWPDPLPLTEEERAAFPVDALPPWIWEYVTAVAEETQTPVDLAAVLALVAVAAIVAKKTKVVEPWPEPLNLYAVVVLAPGELKTAVFKRMTEPIEALEELQCKESKTRREEGRFEFDLAEQRAKETKKTAVKDPSGERLREALEAERRVSQAGFARAPRLVCSGDVTPERLTTLLAEHGGRMAVLDDEGTAFEIMGGRYSNNFDVFLKGHDGGSPLRRDRVGRGDDHGLKVHEPALTLGLTVQPDVINEFASNPKFRGRGLAARFLYSVPRSRKGYRTVGATRVPEAMAKSYAVHLIDLDQIPTGSELGLSDEARTLFLRVWEDIEVRQRPTGDLRDLAEWPSKFPGALLRIAGICHLAERGPTGVDEAITSATMEKVLLLAPYFIDHAKHVLGSGEKSRDLEVARELMERIQGWGSREVRLRDLQRICRLSRAQVDAGLGILVDHALVRMEDVPAHGGHGGRPRRVVIVNPKYVAPRHQSSQLSQASASIDADTRRVRG